MAHPVLVDVSRTVAIKEVPITSNKFLVGRGLHNGFVVEDVNVSRTHCMLERNNNEWSILDKSSNGTWLNGQLLDKSKSHKLSTGDIIGLSESLKFVFKMPSSTSSRAVGRSTKKSLSEDDILNIAESVIADVEAFQAEYESEKFDEADFNNINTNNLEASNANRQSTSCVNVNNANAELNVYAVQPNMCQPTILKFIRTSIGSNNSEQQEVNMEQESRSNGVEQLSGSNQILPLPWDVNMPPVVPQQPQLVEQQPKDSSQKSTGQPQPSNNLEYVEDELQCSICTEMFVQAVTLSCSHTFCKYCITQWQKNQSFCPICRNKITMQFPTRVVDNFIEKKLPWRSRGLCNVHSSGDKVALLSVLAMCRGDIRPIYQDKRVPPRFNEVLESATDEMKQHRRELIEQRQTDPAPVAATASTSSTANNERRRQAQDPIEISSGEENSDEDDYLDDDMSDYSGSDWERDYENDDWYDYNGLPGQYYGGYGHCYSCGQRGHWANGCPNKRR